MKEQEIIIEDDEDKGRGKKTNLAKKGGSKLPKMTKQDAI